MKCTFASITAAIGAAETRELGAGARIVLTGATATSPALFTAETFPLTIPSGLTVTTSDDPDLAGTGLNPANYVVRFGGSATHAVSLQGGGLKGITFKNVRSAAGTAMVLCGTGTTAFESLTLDGLSSAGGLIGTGLQLSSGCVADAAGVRVRDFGGDGVVVDDGADLTLDASKVYGNGGDGLAISGDTSISSSEIAFNGDDGVLLNSSASSTFVGNDVRDNAGNGLEVHAGDSSFSSNQIHNNSRSNGWDQPQVLFSGEDAPLAYGTEEECPFGIAPCFQFNFRGDTDDGCTNGVRNAIYSYNLGDSASGSVGARGINNAQVDAQNNEWASAITSQNVTVSAGSFVAADTTCTFRGGADPDPPPPVE